MTLIYYILFISLLGNILVLWLDVLPFLRIRTRRRLDKYFNRNKTSPSLLEEKIVKRSLDLADLNKTTSFWMHDKPFIHKLIDLIRGKYTKEYRKYNYTKAYLYYGLTEYLKSDKSRLEIIKIKFDRIISQNGQPNFSFDKVDQVPFGLASLNLFEIYEDHKYLSFAHFIFKFLIDCRTEDGIILYRDNANNQLNDVIGMILPFLVRYYSITNDSEALKIGRRQLEFYIKYGTDKETGIPAHGINIRTKIKTGSINWGRGIGWYLLGLSYFNEYNNEFNDQVDIIYNSLSPLKTIENLYTQFPGNSMLIDSSTSTMFIYSFIRSKKESYTKGQIIEYFRKYIDNTGSIIQTSGDTLALNKYSETFGESELTQGMLLLLLSIAENYK